MIPVSRTFTLRLAAAAAAAAAVLPALPAGAAGEQRVTPPTRSIDLACPAERVDGAAFADAATSVHGAAISCLSWYGIAQGGPDGTFGAGGAVTRAQLATFLAKVLGAAGVELPEAAQDAFSDDKDSPHEANLNKLAALGIVNGTGAGTVDPTAPVQRAQMASLLVRVLELSEGAEFGAAVADYFDDDDANVHAAAINLLAERGIAAGRAEAKFEPGAAVLREQMATFVMRVVDRLVEAGAVRVPATLVLPTQAAAPGDVLPVSVLGEQIASVALAGCGFDGAVTDADPATPGVQFELTVPTSWPTDGSTVREDDCAFTVTVTFTDATTQVIKGELGYQTDAGTTTPPSTGGDAGTQPVDQPVSS